MEEPDFFKGSHFQYVDLFLNKSQVYVCIIVLLIINYEQYQCMVFET